MIWGGVDGYRYRRSIMAELSEDNRFVVNRVKKEVVLQELCGLPDFLQPSANCMDVICYLTHGFPSRRWSELVAEYQEFVGCAPFFGSESFQGTSLVENKEEFSISADRKVDFISSLAFEEPVSLTIGSIELVLGLINEILTTKGSLTLFHLNSQYFQTHRHLALTGSRMVKFDSLYKEMQLRPHRFVLVSSPSSDPLIHPHKLIQIQLMETTKSWAMQLDWLDCISSLFAPQNPSISVSQLYPRYFTTFKVALPLSIAELLGLLKVHRYAFIVEETSQAEETKIQHTAVAGQLFGSHAHGLVLHRLVEILHLRPAGMSVNQISSWYRLTYHDVMRIDSPSLVAACQQDSEHRFIIRDHGEGGDSLLLLNRSLTMIEVNCVLHILFRCGGKVSFAPLLLHYRSLTGSLPLFVIDSFHLHSSLFLLDGDTVILEPTRSWHFVHPEIISDDVVRDRVVDLLSLSVAPIQLTLDEIYTLWFTRFQQVLPRLFDELLVICQLERRMTVSRFSRDGVVDFHIVLSS